MVKPVAYPDKRFNVYFKDGRRTRDGLVPRADLEKLGIRCPIAWPPDPDDEAEPEAGLKTLADMTAAEIEEALMILAKTPGTNAHRCYDPETETSRWVPPEGEPEAKATRRRRQF